MFLITTADERTWEKDENYLFLGEWCKLHSRSHIWSNVPSQTLHYHWDDRTRYHEDYSHLSHLYEDQLEILSKRLNDLHGMNASVKYWRIIIGPWLRHFMDAIYDRYCSIKTAAELRDISSTHILKSDASSWIPNDFKEFYHNFTTDQWNHYIYGEIIQLTTTIPFRILDKQNSPPKNGYESIKLPFYLQLKHLLINTYIQLVPQYFNKIVFISSYFDGFWKLFKLQIKLGQLPFPSGPKVEVPYANVNMSKRSQLACETFHSEYERILNKLLPLQIPKSYVESFDVIQTLARKKYPTVTNAIFTANAYSHDDVFKVWAAEQTEKGAKLLIAQHGGNLGSGQLEQREDHQLAISDKYYSWGWFRDDFKNIKPLPATKLLGVKNNINPNNSGNILSVLASFPRYFYCSFSMPIAGQVLDYYSQQVNMLKLLDPKLVGIYKIRLDSHDFGWGLQDRFTNDGYGDNIQSNNSRLIDELKTCRLCIATHNATVFLETFSANIPTIIIWNPEHYEIRESAIPFFDALLKAGILHYTPESAAELLNRIYQDPAEWWMQDKIQTVKDNFCEHYAYVGDNWLFEMKNELKQFKNL